MKPQGRHSGRFHNESGMLSAFVAVIAVALLVIVGLGVDTSRAVAVQRQAADEAEQAARTGAGQVSVGALRAGHLSLDDPAAVQVAQAFIEAGGYSGTAVAGDGTVRVKVNASVPTAILGMVGIRYLYVVGTAEASDVQGVSESG